MRTIGLLFWLKSRLMLRSYRKASAVLGAILLLLVFLPISIGIAIACGAGFFTLEAPAATTLLAGVLCGIYLFWLLAPIVGFAINETYDITRLFIYPLTPRQIFIGAVTGSLLDIQTLLLLPTLAAATAGFGRGLIAFPLTLIAMFLFLFHTLSLSQAILLASAGALKSRRFRDLSTLLFFIVMACYYMGTQYMARAARTLNLAGLIHSPLWFWVRLLPPGAAAEAAGQARMGHIGVALGWLLLLALYTAGAAWLAAWMLERIYAGDVEKAPTSSTPQKEPRNAGVSRGVAGRRSALQAWWEDRVPPVFQAMAAKEARYMVRDPYFRMVLSSLAYVVVVFGFSLYSQTQRAAHNPAYAGTTMANGMLWVFTGLLLLSEAAPVCNQFGAEGRSVAFLFAFPGARLQILMAKNLVLYGVLGLVNALCIMALCALAGATDRIALMLCWSELSLLTFLAAGNLLSIRFPFRIKIEGWRIRYGTGSARFAYLMLYLGILLILVVVMAPVLFALLLPLSLQATQWWALSIPLAVLYAVGLYALSLWLAVPLLRNREQEIIAKMSEEV